MVAETDKENRRGENNEEKEKKEKKNFFSKNKGNKFFFFEFFLKIFSQLSSATDAVHEGQLGFFWTSFHFSFRCCMRMDNAELSRLWYYQMDCFNNSLKDQGLLILGGSKMFQTGIGTSWNNLEQFGTLEHFGTFWNNLEHVGTTWNLGTFWHLLEHLGIHLVFLFFEFFSKTR